MLTVTVQSPPQRTTIETDPNLPPGAYKRDEEALVTVVSDQPLTIAPELFIQGRTFNGGLTAQSTNGIGPPNKSPCCGATANCTCYAVTVSVPPFDAFSGTMVLKARAVSSVNASTGGDGSILVTRWRWVKPLFGNTENFRAPALDGDGNLLVGTNAGGLSAGTLASIQPVTANFNWTTANYGAITAAPVLGSSDAGGILYVATRNAGAAQIRNVNPGSGSLGVSSGCPSLPAETILSAMTIAPATFGGVLAETAFSQRESSSQVRVEAHRANAASQCNTLFNLPAGKTLPEMGMSSTPTAVFLGNANTNEVYRFDLLNLNTANHSVGLNVRTLPISGNVVFGSGNLGATNDGGVFGSSFDGGADMAYPGAQASIGTVGSVAIGFLSAIQVLYFGSSVGPRLNLVSAAGAFIGSQPTNGMVSSTPVLGQGGLVYAATDTGHVYAYDANLNPKWEFVPPMSNPTAFEASPTLDCSAKGSAQTAPGTLYLLGKGNGTVYAFIVDSRGLDTTAPWPKFQHDTRNTGHTGTPIIASGTCQ